MVCTNFIKQFITGGTERRQTQVVILDAGKWKGKWKAKNEGVGSLSLITHLILLLLHLQVDLENLLNYEFLYTYRVHASVHSADCSSEACEQRHLLQKFSSPSVMSLSKRRKRIKVSYKFCVVYFPLWSFFANILFPPYDFCINE